jgi:hypothetical protein
MTRGVEQRRGQRVAATMWVRLSSSGTEIGMGSLVNVSASGAYLETKIQLPVHASITLESTASSAPALEGLKLSARVARIDDRGMGIEWRVLATPRILALLTAPPVRPTDPALSDEFQLIAG